MTSLNISDDILVAYIHRTLSANERQEIEALIRTSAEIEARITQLRATERGISAQITQQLDGVTPPASMNWDKIEKSVSKRKRHRQATAMNRWVPSLVSLCAIIVLGSAAFYSIDPTEPIAPSNGDFPTGGSRQITTTIPATEFIQPTSTVLFSTPFSSIATRTAEAKSTIPTRIPAGDPFDSSEAAE